MKFSDASLRALPMPATGQKLYTDDSLAGFGLRVSTKTKMFVLTYGADRRRVTIGRYPLTSLADARKKAQSILRDRELGIAPRDARTLRAVKAQYLARRDGELRASTLQGDNYLFRHFDGILGRRLDEITPLTSSTSSIGSLLRLLDGASMSESLACSAMR